MTTPIDPDSDAEEALGDQPPPPLSPSDTAKLLEFLAWLTGDSPDGVHARMVKQGLVPSSEETAK